MSLEQVTIQVSPQTAEVLRMLQDQAEARHLPLDVYLRALAETNENDLALSVKSSNGAPPKAELTPQEKARLWMEWTTANAVRVPHPVDDSRESIYTREDECL